MPKNSPLNLRKDSDAFGSFWSYEHAGKTWHASTREAARVQIARFKAETDSPSGMLDAMFGWVKPVWLALRMAG